MQIELRKLKIVAALSQETTCYSAEVWIDGQRAFLASNHGHGAADMFHAVGHVSETDVDAWLAANRAPMDETMGPNEAECPERILALLGETDHASALDWRRRCLDRLAQRSTRPLEHGMHIRLPRTIKFTDGHEGTDFIVHKRGRKIALAKLGSDYAGYRISGLRDMAWTVVPPPAQTRVHKTVFG